MATRTARCSRPVLATVMLVLAAAAGGAEWVRLSQGDAFSDVLRYAVSPDGKWVVYSQTSETFFPYDLWSVRLPAGAPVKLSGTPLDDFSRFSISPDSSRVVYTAPQETGGLDLYSIPIGGPAGAGVKLNGTLVAGGDVLNIDISRDSARVVYNADQQTDEVLELYSVPLSGPASAGVKLNRPLIAGGTVPFFWISPNNARVVYHANQETVDVVELYSVPIAGPASAGVKLNGALVSGGFAGEVKFNPTGNRVVYRADQEAVDVFELYSVPVAGPASSGVKLNGTLPTGGDVGNVEISPNGSRVVYSADQQTDDVFELYGVPLVGPATAGIKLNGALVAGGDVSSFKISPDSARVVYRADQQTDEVFELYSVPLAGPAGAGVKLNRALVANGDVETEFAISADSAWVVYAADQELDGFPTGHRAPLAGPAGSDEVIWGSAVHVPSFFMITPDSAKVAVLGNRAFVDSIDRIWSYPLASAPDPNGTDLLAGQFQPNGDVIGPFELLPDGSGAVYIADQEVDSQLELYRVSIPLASGLIHRDGFED